MCHNSSADSAQSWLKTVAYPDECDAIPSSVIKHALRLVACNWKISGNSWSISLLLMQCP